MKKLGLAKNRFWCILLALEAILLAMLVLSRALRTSGVRAGWIPLCLAGCLVLDGLVLLFFYDRAHREEPGYLQKRRVFLLLAVVVIAASWPLATDYLPEGHDLEFHLLRIEGIADGLRDGQFPVRIQPNTADGYGYAVSVFYPDLLLYAPALLRLAGLPVMAAYKLFCVFLNALTAAVAYLAFAGIFASRKLGLIGSAAYTLSLYRLVCLYTRAAVGEVSAMTFLPLVLFGIYRILSGNTEEKAYRWSFLPLALGMAGLVYTHLLSCEIVLPLLLIGCLACLRRTFQGKRLLSILKAAGTALLLSLAFLVPMADYTLHGNYQVFSWSLYDRTPDAASLAQLFPLLPSGGGESNPLSAGIPGEMSLGVGFGYVLILLAFLPVYFHWKKRPGPAAGEKSLGVLGLVSFLLGVLCLFMATSLFPWYGVYRMGGIFASLANMLQFPWRMLAAGTLLLLAAFCQSLRMLTLSGERERAPGFAAVVLAALLFTSLAYTDRMLQQTPVYRAYVAADMDNTRGIGDGEYLPVSFRALPENEPEATGCAISAYAAEGTRLTFNVRAADADGYVDLPRTYYPGYEAVFSGDAALTVSESPGGLLRVRVPGGCEGGVSVSYRENPLWRAAWCASLMTLPLLAVLYGLERRKAKRSA